MEGICREWENREPCGAMFDQVMSLDLDTLTQDQLVTACILIRKIKATAGWCEWAIVSRVGDTTELAMAIKEPGQTVARRPEQSEGLGGLPQLAEQVRHGDLDPRRVEAVRERITHLDDPALVKQVEDALVDVAAGLNHTQLCRKTTGLVAQADPEGYERRCQKAKAERRVEYSPLPDGMAKLGWILPATEARVIHEQVCRDAKNLPKDDRTTDQKRCDVLLDRVLGKTRDWNVRTYVTISMETLLGLTNDPG